MTDSFPEAKLWVRIDTSDAHYAGNLVDGARILNIFGDLATELTIRYDGDEGLLRAYDKVEFLAPVYSGDFIEAIGKITRVGKTSREINFEAYKGITSTNIDDDDDAAESSCDVLNSPILVAKAIGTSVVIQEKQRKRKRR